MRGTSSGRLRCGSLEQAVMIPPFDIFKRQPGGRVRWFGVATDLENAKQRLKELAASSPGEYFLFSQASGQRLFIPPDGEQECSEAKAPTSEPVGVREPGFLRGGYTCEQ